MTLVPVLLLFAVQASAAASSEDSVEPGSAEAIAAATTDPRFLSPWVSYLPESATVPSPRDFFGRIMGAPGELVDTAKAHAYARALAAASPRVRVFPIGRSEEGREILMIAVADDQGILDLDRLKDATARLADPRRTDPAAAEAIVASARPVYYFNAALHSDESGSTESVLELVYRLAVSEEPMARRIRNELVVLVNAVSNPDGRDRFVEWFYRYLKGRTDYATLPRQSPPYWSKYAFVDINRDAHQQTHETTKAVHRMFHEWHPTVVHDLHEAIPLMLTWNGTGPYNPHLDPITHGEFLELSFHEVRTMTALGMPGVWTWKFGEAFGHHYLDSVAMNHNSLGRGYETFGNATAETVRRELDADDVTMEWFRPAPPPSRSFSWSARDNVNYNETGALAALDHTARNAKEFLRSFYRKGYNSWRKGLEEAPYGFVIPNDQGDRARVADMVNRLVSQKIEVGVATASVSLEDGGYHAGSYVVKLDQPYRNYAVDLLTPQRFPKDGGQPYDDISWELPAHYRLDVHPTADPAVRSVPVTPLAGRPDVKGSVSGTGPVFALKDTGQEALLGARYRLAKFDVGVAEKPFRVGTVEYPAGSWILPAQNGLDAALRETANELALDFASLAAVPDVLRHAAKAPRLGVWVPWADTDSIGWIRYSLDQRKVPYTYIRDEDIRAGKLLEVDVLLYGHVDLELPEQIQGLPKAWGPMPYKKTEATPSHGAPAESDDITGGIGYEGLAQIERFVRDGGLLVTLGSGSMLPLEGGIVRGVRRAAGGVPRSEDGDGGSSASASSRGATRTPGAHVRARFARPDHPLAYGYPERLHVFRQNFPLYDAPRAWLRMAYCTSCLDGPEDRSGVVLEWGAGDGGPFVVSGQAWGESNLVGRPAILDMPAGRGHVVAFNFNPLHRDLNRGDHRLVWNAILNWQRIVAPAAR
jgi:Zinc carboxypeptidase